MVGENESEWRDRPAMVPCIALQSGRATRGTRSFRVGRRRLHNTIGAAAGAAVRCAGGTRSASGSGSALGGCGRAVGGDGGRLCGRGAERRGYRRLVQAMLRFVGCSAPWRWWWPRVARLPASPPPAYPPLRAVRPEQGRGAGQAPGRAAGPPAPGASRRRAPRRCGPIGWRTMRRHRSCPMRAA